MVICGISGRGPHAAAAIAVDGRLVSAVEQARLNRRGDDRAGALPLAAIEACLVTAGLTVRDVSQFVRAEGHVATLERAPSRRRFQALGIDGVRGYGMSRLAAVARLAYAVGAPAVIAADGPAAMFVSADQKANDLRQSRALLALACRVASALGLAHDDAAEAVSALEQLASTQAPSGHQWFGGITSSSNTVVDVEAFDRALAKAAFEAGGPLDKPTPLVRKERIVVDVADAFLTTLASHFGDLVRIAGSEVMLAGALFGSPDFVARVSRAAGVKCHVAPSPSAHTAALGAALSDGQLSSNAIPRALALGPSVGDDDAKAVIENCRLDYVYEPHWQRLLERVSRVLERGKLVAWFQGRAEFGYPFFGSRSFLCDPSSRYARDNINVFLRRQPLSTPIPVSIGSNSRDCVNMADMSPLSLTRAAVGGEWRDLLRAGLDTQGCVHAHVVPDDSGPLSELLATHQQRTGVPGLANVPLSAPDDVPAMSPRDAVRAAFASSADALVIHRFLVMKDYWQMRDEL